MFKSMPGPNNQKPHAILQAGCGQPRSGFGRKENGRKEEGGFPADA